MGFNVGRPNTVQLENDRTDNFLRNIRNNLKDTTQMVSLGRRGGGVASGVAVCLLPLMQSYHYGLKN